MVPPLDCPDGRARCADRSNRKTATSRGQAATRHGPSAALAALSSSAGPVEERRPRSRKRPLFGGARKEVDIGAASWVASQCRVFTYSRSRGGAAVLLGVWR